MTHNSTRNGASGDSAGPGHAHAHAPSHTHGDNRVVLADGDPEAGRSALSRGAGRGKLLFFDAQSGIAGDMTIAALVDLGVPFVEVERAVGALDVTGAEMSLHRAFAGAIGATRFDVRVEGAQPARSYRVIDELLERSSLAEEVSRMARSIFRRLAEAEAEVHRIDVSQVHFHEVGAVDAIVDIVGAAACLEYLGARVACSPLPMGHGHVHCQHGRLPLPAPATVGCLRGVPTYEAGIEAELVTPTGAAIVATVAQAFSRWPALAVERVGWGAGARSLTDRPNVLRVVLGEAHAGASPGGSTHEVIEANVDDMTGELVGHALLALMDAGALDVWATPVTMKKGRPGWTLGALAAAEDGEHVAHRLLRETSTIGVRRTGVGRIERPRDVVDVETPFGSVPVKISSGPYGPPQIKPEFDACVQLARRAGVTVREVLRAAERAAELALESDPSRRTGR